VPDHGNFREFIGVGEASRLHPDRVKNPSDGADGVPYAEKMRFAVPSEGALKSSGNSKSVWRAFEFRQPAVSLLEESHGIRNQALVSRTEKAHHLQHAAERARGISAPAETENVNGILLFKGLHQEAIGVHDVFRQAIAEREAAELCPGPSGLGEGAHISHRANARVIISDLPSRNIMETLVELYNIRLSLSILVSSAIAADNNVFHAKPSTHDLSN